MIVVKIQGGIGNQLFQYAIARALAIKNNTGFKLHLPDDSIKRAGFIKKEIYKILKFIPIKIRKIQEIIYFSQYPRTFHLMNLGISQTLVINDVELNKIRMNEKMTNVLEKQFNFDSELVNLPDNIYLDGFWQSEKYFSNYEKIIRSDLTIDFGNEITYVEKISNTNSIAIHVRRGDYHLVKENQTFGTLNIEYYQKGIDYICKTVHNPVFYIFSDDENWVKSTFLKEIKATNIELIKGRKANRTYIDLCQISLCKHAIVANSSFSWWGAWLNKNPGKIIVAPQKSFAGEYYTDDSDYYPSEWVRL